MGLLALLDIKGKKLTFIVKTGSGKLPNPTTDAMQAQLYAPPHRLLLRIYHGYRVIISLLLLLIALSGWQSVLWGASSHPAFLASSWLYLAVNALLAIGLQRPKRMLSVLVLALSDVLLLSLLNYTAGGVASGIGNFLVVSVAVANILLHGRIGLFIAAIAALGLLLPTVYLYLETNGAASGWLQAGSLGGLCFAAALLAQWLSKRLNLSERLAAQHARSVARLEALNAHILERMHTGILLFDEQRTILLANAESKRLFGLAELVGQRIDHLNTELVHCFKNWQANPGLHPPSLKLQQDGPLLQAGFMPMEYGGKQHCLVFLEDLAKTLQQAQQIKLVALGRLSAAIAHEIRNPLAAISHAAQLLQESTGDGLQNEDLRFIRIICEQTQRLNRVVENVLQLSRPRERQGEPRLIELGAWLYQFVCDLRPTLPPEHCLHFKPRSSDKLYTHMEPSQLLQVLTNLIQNGLRYSARENNGKGQVWLELYRHEDSGQPVLDVLDDGGGVAENIAVHLFEPFHSSESQGSGLGLYVSRELCELNRARLDYLPRQAGGSCMRITFAYPNDLKSHE